jgi:hypothetical protein
VLPPEIVEPVIAASIVVVAVENLVRRDAQLTRRRLAVAFVFGLVHGMGLGGALLENLKDLPGGAAGWAIAAFCVGVEIGHLCVVAPLSGVLKIGRDLWQERFRLPTLRWGSLLIALGGAWYLAAALGLMPGPGGE